MMTTMTMIRNGVMTQQSCAQSDAHDVFFVPSGFFVKQQQIQCHTPQTHLRADRLFAKTESSGVR